MCSFTVCTCHAWSDKKFRCLFLKECASWLTLFFPGVSGCGTISWSSSSSSLTLPTLLLFSTSLANLLPCPEKKEQRKERNKKKNRRRIKQCLPVQNKTFFSLPTNKSCAVITHQYDELFAQFVRRRKSLVPEVTLISKSVCNHRYTKWQVSMLVMDMQTMWYSFCVLFEKKKLFGERKGGRRRRERKRKG